MKSFLIITLFLSLSVFANGDLSGEINGKSWSLASGVAKAFSGNKYRLSLWEEVESDECNVSFPESKNNVEAMIPLELGTHQLNSEDMVVLSYVRADGMPWNIIIKSGTITIQEINNDFVIGAISASYNKHNYVSGTFIITNCGEKYY